jgi:hypothetical protein
MLLEVLWLLMPESDMKPLERRFLRAGLTGCSKKIGLAMLYCLFPLKKTYERNEEVLQFLRNFENVPQGGSASFRVVTAEWECKAPPCYLQVGDAMWETPVSKQLPVAPLRGPVYVRFGPNFGVRS